jgi:hypothetical protein
MKVSKTVSIDLELLQKVIELNPNFSKAVTEALHNWLIFNEETQNGNAIHLSKVFETKIPPQVIWQFLTFDGIVKWDKMLYKVEYLTENTTGVGARCKLYGRVNRIESTSIAEIIEYKEYERIAYRSTGDLRIFSSATLKPKNSKTEMVVVIVIGLSDELSSTENKKDIRDNLELAFSNFETHASKF